MSVFQTFGLIITLAATGAYVNRRWLQLPSTIGLMAFSLVMSLVAVLLSHLGIVDMTAATTFVSGINFSHILLHGMLSFLLFAGALHVNLSDLKKNHIIIAILATVGVGIAAMVTGGIVWQASKLFGHELSFVTALMFGALIAPTDPVAVLGILQQTNMSKNLQVKIGCESLLNDGVGVVLFVAVLALETHPGISISFSDILVLMLFETIASLALGVVLGWIVIKLLASINDYKVEALLTLALVAGGYSFAEFLHVSAPITIVAAGLVIGNAGGVFEMPFQNRRHHDLFWDLIDDIMNTVLFTLIGLQMMVIPLNSLYLAMGLAAIIAALSGRFISVALPVTLMKFFYDFERGTIALLTWGGLRGGIAIALALSIPPGPDKDLILGMTYMTVVFSVLFQGTTFRHFAAAIVKNPADSA